MLSLHAGNEGPSSNTLKEQIAKAFEEPGRQKPFEPLNQYVAILAKLGVPFHFPCLFDINLVTTKTKLCLHENVNEWVDDKFVLVILINEKCFIGFDYISV